MRTTAIALLCGCLLLTAITCDDSSGSAVGAPDASPDATTTTGLPEDAGAGGHDQADADGAPPPADTGLGFPGAVGFGDNRGAFAAPGGVEIYVVTCTDPAEPATPSTRNGVDVVTGGFRTLLQRDPGADKGRVFIFETSGVIDFGGARVAIQHPYVSIFGQTAPGDGVLLKGGILAIVTGHVVIQHLRIRPGGDRTYSWSNCDNHSALRVETGAGPLIVDHCSLSWAVDAVACFYGSLADITLQRSIVSEPLYLNCHSKGGHSRGVQWGDPVSRYTMYRNLVAHSRDRSPSNNGTWGQIVNNVIYNSYAANIKYDKEQPTAIHTIRGNNVRTGPESAPGADFGVWFKDTMVQPDVAVYIDDLVCHACSDDYSASCSPATAGLVNDGAQGAVVASEPQEVSTAALDVASALDLMDPAHADYLLGDVGAYPTRRDSTDLCVIDDVQNGTGQYIDDEDTPGGCGPWDDIQAVAAQHALPADPFGDEDDDGWTNLEEWIHGT